MLDQGKTQFLKPEPVEGYCWHALGLDYENKVSNHEAAKTMKASLKLNGMLSSDAMTMAMHKKFSPNRQMCVDIDDVVEDYAKKVKQLENYLDEPVNDLDLDYANSGMFTFSMTRYRVSVRESYTTSSLNLGGNVFEKTVVTTTIHVVRHDTGINPKNMLDLLIFYFRTPGKTVIGYDGDSVPTEAESMAVFLKATSSSMQHNSDFQNRLKEKQKRVLAHGMRAKGTSPIPVPQNRIDLVPQLQAEFPQFDFFPSSSLVSPHPYHHVSRMAVTNTLVDYFPSNIPLFDVGGKFDRHIHAGNYNVHSCFKVEDPVDFARGVDNMLSLVKKRLTKINSVRPGENEEAIQAMLSITDGSHKYFCFEDAENCQVKPSDEIGFSMSMSVDTLWFLSMETLGNIYVQKKIIKAKHALTIPDGLLWKDEGKLSRGEGTWAKRNGKLIMNFNGGSHVYVNSVNTIMMYLTSPFFIYEDFVIVNRVDGRLGPYTIFNHHVIPKTDFVETMSSSSLHAVWSSSDPDIVIMKVPKIDIFKPVTLLFSEPFSLVKQEINFKFMERLKLKLLSDMSFEEVLEHCQGLMTSRFLSTTGYTKRFNMTAESVRNHAIIAFWEAHELTEAFQPLVKRASQKIHSLHWWTQAWNAIKQVFIKMGREFDPSENSELTKLIEQGSHRDFEIESLLADTMQELDHLRSIVNNGTSSSIFQINAPYYALVYGDGAKNILTNVNNLLCHPDFKRIHMHEMASNDETPVTTAEFVPCVFPEGFAPVADHSVKHQHVLPFSKNSTGICKSCGIFSTLFGQQCVLCSRVAKCVGANNSCPHAHSKKNEHCCGLDNCSHHEPGVFVNWVTCFCCLIPSVTNPCLVCDNTDILKPLNNPNEPELNNDGQQVLPEFNPDQEETQTINPSKKAEGPSTTKVQPEETGNRIDPNVTNADLAKHVEFKRLDGTKAGAWVLCWKVREICAPVPGSTTYQHQHNCPVCGNTYEHAHSYKKLTHSRRLRDCKCLKPSRINMLMNIMQSDIREKTKTPAKNFPTQTDKTEENREQQTVEGGNKLSDVGDLTPSQPYEHDNGEKGIVEKPSPSAQAPDERSLLESEKEKGVISANNNIEPVGSGVPSIEPSISNFFPVLPLTKEFPWPSSVALGKNKSNEKEEESPQDEPGAIEETTGKKDGEKESLDEEKDVEHAPVPVAVGEKAYEVPPPSIPSDLDSDSENGDFSVAMEFDWGFDGEGFKSVKPCHVMDRELHCHQCRVCGSFYSHSHRFTSVFHKQYLAECPVCESGVKLTVVSTLIDSEGTSHLQDFQDNDEDWVDTMIDYQRQLIKGKFINEPGDLSRTKSSNIPTVSPSLPSSQPVADLPRSSESSQLIPAHLVTLKENLKFMLNENPHRSLNKLSFKPKSIITRVNVLVRTLVENSEDGKCGAASLSLTLEEEDVARLSSEIEECTGKPDFWDKRELGVHALSYRYNLVVAHNSGSYLYYGDSTSDEYILVVHMYSLTGKLHWQQGSGLISPSAREFSDEYNNMARAVVHLYNQSPENTKKVKTFSEIPMMAGWFSNPRDLLAMSNPVVLTLLETFGADFIDGQLIHKSQQFKSSILHYITVQDGLLLIAAPTGHGKTTRIHSELVRNVLSKSGKTLIVTPSRATITGSFEYIAELNKCSVAGRANQQWYASPKKFEKTPWAADIVLLTVDSMYDYVTKVIQGDQRPWGERYLFLDEFHDMTWKYATIVKRLGPEITGIMTATLTPELASVDTKYQVTMKLSAMEPYVEESDDKMGAFVVVGKKTDCYLPETHLSLPHDVNKNLKIEDMTKGVPLNSDSIGMAKLANITSGIGTNAVTTGSTIQHAKLWVDKGIRYKVSWKPENVYSPNRKGENSHLVDVVPQQYSLSDMLQSRGRVINQMDLMKRRFKLITAAGVGPSKSSNYRKKTTKFNKENSFYLSDRDVIDAFNKSKVSDFDDFMIERLEGIMRAGTPGDWKHDTDSETNDGNEDENEFVPEVLTLHHNNDDLEDDEAAVDPLINWVTKVATKGKNYITTAADHFISWLKTTFGIAIGSLKTITPVLASFFRRLIGYANTPCKILIANFLKLGKFSVNLVKRIINWTMMKLGVLIGIDCLEDLSDLIDDMIDNYGVSMDSKNPSLKTFFGHDDQSVENEAVENDMECIQQQRKSQTLLINKCKLKMPKGHHLAKLVSKIMKEKDLTDEEKKLFITGKAVSYCNTKGKAMEPVTWENVCKYGGKDPKEWCIYFTFWHKMIPCPVKFYNLGGHVLAFLGPVTGLWTMKEGKSTDIHWMMDRASIGDEWSSTIAAKLNSIGGSPFEGFKEFLLSLLNSFMGACKRWKDNLAMKYEVLIGKKTKWSSGRRRQGKVIMKSRWYNDERWNIQYKTTLFKKPSSTNLVEHWLYKPDDNFEMDIILTWENKTHEIEIFHSSHMNKYQVERCVKDCVLTSVYSTSIQPKDSRGGKTAEDYYKKLIGRVYAKPTVSDSVNKLIKRVVLNNPLMMQFEAGLQEISDTLVNDRQIEKELMEPGPSTDVTRFYEGRQIIYAPSGCGKTFTTDLLNKEYGETKLVDIDTLLTINDMTNLDSIVWDWSAVKSQYVLAFNNWVKDPNSKGKVLMCHSPEQTGYKKGLIVLPTYDLKKTWAPNNLKSLKRIAKARRGFDVVTVNSYNDFTNAIKDYITCFNDDFEDSAKFLSNTIDSIEGDEFFNLNKDSTTQTLLRTPAEGKVALKNDDDLKLGTERFYVLGNLPEVNRPTLDNAAYSLMNAITTRLHGIETLRKDKIETSEYLELFRKFIVTQEFDSNIPTWANHLIRPNLESTRDWLINKGNLAANLAKIYRYSMSNIERFDPKRARAHFKSENLMKEMVLSATEQIGRVIVWHEQHISSIICPLMQEAKYRLKSVLKTKHVYYDGMNVTSLNSHLKTLKKSKHIICLDLSKQDRQTDRPLLETEHELMRLLGVDPLVIEYLKQAEDKFILRTSNNISSIRPGMRWTGGEMTAIGNEIRNLLLLADLEAHGLIIDNSLTLGDDSMLFCDNELDEEVIKRIAMERHNVRCTYESNHPDMGLFVQLIVGWVEGSGYCATPSWWRLDEKLTVSKHSPGSLEHLAKSHSFLMMVGYDSDTAKASNILGMRVFINLGTTAYERLRLNAYQFENDELTALQVKRNLLSKITNPLIRVMKIKLMVNSKKKTPLYAEDEIKLNFNWETNVIDESMAKKKKDLIKSLEKLISRGG
ncbi:polyprotein [Tuber aestivum betaendornavirus]|uniref:Polyprotein n=1 Tax=Tuber aestivum betaendornavirus TaxID=941765 RepID=E9MZX5_9VIRU|nr:polyprotein [Tuber aestivum betaendornavirus]ADU64759.1 polyprotein [Tuber aestivum betaendornavirus]